MINTSILRWEELAINAFPANATELYNGWLLRYSNGYTYRGNSVNPLYAGVGSLEAQVTACEKRYASRNMPCIFKITPDTEPELDLLLQCRGYRDAKHADIMAREIKEDTFSAQSDVTVVNTFTDKWFTNFAQLNCTSEEPDFSTMQHMLHTISNPVFCGSIYENFQMTGCALGVQEERYVGIFDVRVSEQYRRQGMATRICMEILRQAVKHGASVAYLQVASQNQAAISLYQKLGFTYQYTYWYRIKELTTKGTG